ncbi:MAG: transglycosylase SLT domain-containing protein [Alphaproteobacteria bacterium]|nr:transglycosylase SLT domain-containing protein [Alphaproteobacteria bacterium]
MAAALAALAAGALLAPSSAGRAEPAPVRSADAATPPAAVGAPDPSAQTVPVGVQPKVLSQKDVELYRKIFDVQKDGHWAEADKLIRQVKDTTLMGHVLYQRYMHPTKYRSSYRELRDWMTLYSDLPDADKVYTLAMRRKPAREVAPVEPVPDRYKPPPPPEVELSDAEKQRRAAEYKVRSAISAALSSKNPAQAERALRAGKGVLDKPAFNAQLTLIAKAYYFQQDYRKALDLGDDASDRDDGEVAEAGWFGGLAAWRLEKYGKSAKLFVKTANATDGSTGLSAAGAYWAARAYLRDREPEKALEMLQTAAQHRRTFYGILAARQLDQKLDYDWSPPTITQADLNEALNYPGVRRAIALQQVGDRAMADEEMQLVARRLSPDQPRAGLMKVAFRLNFTGTAVALARYTERNGGPVVEAALFPMPDFSPEDGFKLDRALLFAFARQESNFMARATSWAGARGLMQLMPSTAGYIAHDNSLKDRNVDRLYDAGFNMMLGQKYLMYLFDKDVTQGNLMLVAAAYNAGPGNVAKWLDRDDSGGDWLLFMESIPVFETRGYVEHVLENLWVYRARLGQPSPALTALIAGAPPRYSPSDSRELAAQ